MLEQPVSLGPQVCNASTLPCCSPPDVSWLIFCCEGSALTFRGSNTPLLAIKNNANPNTPTLSKKERRKNIEKKNRIDQVNMTVKVLCVFFLQNETVAQIIHLTNKYVQMNK